MDTMEVYNNDINLITLVERFPQLYDKSNKGFKDRMAVENAWLFISGELQIPTDNCIHRWTSIRSRFSKERNKKTPSGSAAEKTEWPLMKYLTFLQLVVKKRRTFGNISKEKSPWESQTYDDEDASLMEKDDTLVECTNYEYLEDETVSDTCSDLPMEESFEPLNLDGHEERLATPPVVAPQRATTSDTCLPHRPITPNTPISQRSTTPNTFTSQKPTTPNTSIPQRPITPNTPISQKSTTPNTFTPQKPTTLNTSIPQRPITPNTPISQRSTTPNTFTPQKPTTPNTSIPQRPITPNTPISQRSTTPNTFTPLRPTPNTISQTPILNPLPSQRPITPNTSVSTVNKKRKQFPGIEEHLSDAVDVFKNYVTHKNTATTEDDSLKHFCNSLYGDLKNLDKKDVISCKIEIMQIISKYT